jgi:undecaprenyl-phosphate galactose phosphotransferase
MSSVTLRGAVTQCRGALAVGPGVSMGFVEMHPAEPHDIPQARPVLGALGERLPVTDPRKRALDVLLAALGLLLVLPLLLILTLLVWSDGGPAFFRQTRVGAYGAPFLCLKFRTMRVDAEAVLQAALAQDPTAAHEWEERRKLSRDPRITWLGRFLRAASLDELPQLLNVLRGDMSLVGPRPIMTDEIPRFGADIVYYYQTRPGLTGLWQVSGRSDLPYAMRVELDVQYVRGYSLRGDLAILRRTVNAVLSQRGAR